MGVQPFQKVSREQLAVVIDPRSNVFLPFFTAKPHENVAKKLTIFFFFAHQLILGGNFLVFRFSKKEQTFCQRQPPRQKILDLPLQVTTIA